jgi:hypothetical protein
MARRFCDPSSGPFYVFGRAHDIYRSRTNNNRLNYALGRFTSFSVAFDTHLFTYFQLTWKRGQLAQ